MQNLNTPQIIRGPLTDRDLLDPDFGDVPAPAEACTELGADCEPPTWLDLAWLYVTLAVSLVALCALAGYVICTF